MTLLHPSTAGAEWARWGGDPTSLATLAVVLAGYATGVRAAWRHAGRGSVIGVAETRWFAFGVLALAVALCSPIDALSDELFVAHMTQHLLLATVAPPFLVLGAPVLALVWALPPHRRRQLARATRRPFVLRRAWWFVTRPAVAALVHAAAVWLWHAPRAYDWALRSRPAHLAEHLSFVGTACLMWYAILRGHAPARARCAAGILVLFATMLHTGALGALMTVSSRPWYPRQGTGAAAWGLTALEDQQLAGLVMWVVGGLLDVVAMSVLFLHGLSLVGRRARVVVRAAAVAGTALIAGCRPATPSAIAGGDAERGRVSVAGMGCGSCHTIAGVRTAHGLVGPPLTGVASRSLLAGRLPNTPDNMLRWIVDPPAVDSATAMPNLHLDDQTARDIVAYLYTLK